MPRKPKKRTWHTLKWFQNHRGKIIYRNPIKTARGLRCCDMCEKTEVEVFKPKKGMPDHAQYLLDCSRELNIEYFNKPVEKRGYEKKV